MHRLPSIIHEYLKKSYSEQWGVFAATTAFFLVPLSILTAIMGGTLLKLPIETEVMIFPRLSDITAADLEQAKRLILDETAPEKHCMILSEHVLWKSALDKREGFSEVKNRCAQEKDEALNQIDYDDDLAVEVFYQEFKEKDKTIWNPYYLLTKQLLEAGF